MGKPLPFRLILASGSRDRRKLLAAAGYQFDVMPADIAEPTEALFGDCRQFVQQVAWMKAAAVAPKVASGVILTADTVGWHNGKVIGKPADEADARRIIRELGGTVHELWTGCCLWRRPDDWQLGWQEFSRCRVKEFSPTELDAYIGTNRWVGCSGAYSIDGPDDPYVEVVSGSVSNVIGLPMESLERMLTMVAKG
ncbi:MAG: Maf family protein [Gemmataceae bacterium]